MAALQIAVVSSGATPAGAATSRRASEAQSMAKGVHLSAEKVRQLLFVSGDVVRLSRASSTADLMLERVLQELYRQNPQLDETTAKAAIQALQTGATLPSDASLEAQGPNERILSVLQALQTATPEKASRPGRATTPRSLVDSALRAVTAEALRQSLQTGPADGKRGLSADLVPTLAARGFDASTVLGASAALARREPAFGRVRDMLWRAASGQSVFDSSQHLLARAPRLRELVDGRGRLRATTVAALVQRVDAELEAVNDTAREALSSIGSAESAVAAAEAIDARETIRDDALESMTFEAMALGSAEPGWGQTLRETGDVIVGFSHALDQLSDAMEAGEEVAAWIKRASWVAFGGNFVGAAFALTTLAAGSSSQTTDTLILQEVQELREDVASFREEAGARFDRLDRTLLQLDGTIGDVEDELRGARVDLQFTLEGLAVQQVTLDRLQANLYEAIVAAAQRPLFEQWDLSLGYAKRYLRRLPLEDFIEAESRFRTYARKHPFDAASVLSNENRGFTPDDVWTQIDPATHTLEENVEYLRELPAASGWGLAPLGGTALPNPKNWKVGATAYAQLLTENPDYVTPAMLEDLTGIIGVGRLVATMEEKIGEADVPTRTRSALFNRLLDNYGQQLGLPGDQNPDSLSAQIESVEADYLKGLGGVARPSLGYPADLYAPEATPLAGVNLFGGPEQSFAPTSADRPDAKDDRSWRAAPGYTEKDRENGVPAWTNDNDDVPGSATGRHRALRAWAPVCRLSAEEKAELPKPGGFGRWQNGATGLVFTLPEPHLDAAVAAMPPEVLLARRLGAGNLQPCVRAYYAGPTKTYQRDDWSSWLLTRDLVFEVRWFFARPGDPRAEERDPADAVVWTTQTLPDECVGSSGWVKKWGPGGFNGVGIFIGCLSNSAKYRPLQKLQAPKRGGDDGRAFPALLNLWFTWDTPPSGASGLLTGPSRGCRDETGEAEGGNRACWYNVPHKRRELEYYKLTDASAPQAWTAFGDAAPNAAVVREVRDAIADELRPLQREQYARILADLGQEGSALAEARHRLDGARDLLVAYAELGLSGALKSSLTLEERVRSRNSGLIDGDDVVARYARQAQAPADIRSDARDALLVLARDRRSALEDALGDAIIVGQRAPASRLDMGSSLVNGTLNRLKLTRSLLTPMIKVKALTTTRARSTVMALVACPTSVVGACQGRLVLSAPSGRTRSTIANPFSVRIPSGTTAQVAVPVNRAGRRLLATRHSTQVSAAATIYGAAGGQHTSVALMSLRIAG